MSITAMRKIIAACAAWVGVAFAAPAIWDGSADISWYEYSAQAYNLTTAEQLAGLAKLVNDGVSDFKGKTITLGADIFLNDTAGVGTGTWASVPHTEWTPIGTSSRPFKGEFDGIAGKKNRKIYGLYINGTTKDYVGLFGYTSNVKISNLDVLVGQITAKDNVGALVGYAAGGSVTNVHSEIKVTGNNHVGGLVGYSTGNLSTSSVKENVVGQDSVGGLIGITTGSVSGTAKSNSYFIGNVTGRMYVGGLVGHGSAISSSYAEGSVNGDSNYVGGVAGYVSGSINSVHHVGGDVVGAKHYVGGLVGYGSAISSSYAEGSVKGDSNYVGGVAGYASGKIYYVHHAGGGVVGAKHYVGGLVGYGSVISKSYAKGSVNGDSNYVGGVAGYVSGTIDSVHHFGGNVDGSNYVGGVVGYASGAIDSVHHIGDYINGKSIVGGVAGYAGQSVINSYSETKVVGTDYVGGLIGLAIRRVHTDSLSDDNTYIKKSYSVGDVRGTRYVGGLIGCDSLYKILNDIQCVKWGIKNKYGLSQCVEYSNDNYSTKIVRTITSTSSKGNVEGNSYVGGLIGAQSVGSDSSNKYMTSRHFAFNVQNSNHSGSVSGSASYIGGLIGLSRGMISTAYHIDGNVIGYGNYVGGLVGRILYNFGECTSVTLTMLQNSYAVGNVKGNDFVGGLIGNDYVYKGELVRINTFILKSYSKGNIEGNMYVGGVVGMSNHEIKSSYYDYDVHKTINSSYHIGGDVIGKNDYVGGVAGFTEGSIESSYHSGGFVDGRNYVGGLIGLALQSTNASDTTYIKNSYSNGGVKGGMYVGGFIGADSMYKQLQNRKSHFDDKPIVRIISKNSSKGTVQGISYVGGLIGTQSVGSDSSNRYISSNYIKYSMSSCNHSNGDVFADSNYVGGLIGYARGDVDSVFHTGGDISGHDWVGGLIGYGNDSIMNSYSEGDVNGYGYVGGLVGEISSSVKNSFFDGNVTGKNKYVGGLIGNGGLVSKCYAKGIVVSNSSYVGGVAGYASSVDSTYHIDGDVVGSSYVGGLVGLATSVKNSYSKGHVTGASSYVGGLIGSGVSVDSSNHTKGDVRGYEYVGGLIGRASSSVKNSYSEGNVTGTSYYVGGIAGSVSGKIRNSNAEAKYVKGRNLVGGLAGYVADSIEVSYFEGDSVTGIYQIGGLAGYAKSAVDSSYSTAHVKGDDNVGGLIGSAYGDVSNSYAIGNIVGDEEHSSAGNDNLGGLVGYQYSGSVSKSMAWGDVSGTTKLGGLVGRFDGTKISQSYANGNVTGRYYGDPADEVGNYYIGGLVGYAKGTLEETYASGVVKGIENDPVYTGCVVGYVNGSLSISKSYYDKTKCGLGVDGGEYAASVSGKPDKTTAEMQSQETFEDWDFTNTWKIMEGTYPFLQIYSNSLTNAVVKTEPLEGYEYDGTAKTPLVTSVTLFGETLKYETEYTVTYKDNINAGTASINVCGVKPYGGCKVVEFEIAGIAVKPTIATIDNETYTGRALTPEIKVYNGETLLATTDYAVEYKDNVNAGKATVTVTMKGNYSGSASKTFTIEKATPVISQNPKASDVVLGLTLASSELSDGQANVDGEFVWKSSETKPTLENEGYAVIFVPTDADNYTKSAEVIVPVKVLEVVYVAVHADAVTLDSVVLVKGAEYTLPEVPEKTGFDFKGLYKGKSEVGKVGNKIVITENTVIDAVYQVKTFMVSFLNGSVELQTGEVAYGEMPKYSGDIPTKASTAQYAYLFKDWSPELTTVTEAASYTAVFDSVVNKYEITFANGAETLQSDSVLYGDLPEYKGTTAPTKSSTEKYDYVFNSWSPAITSVTGAATYTAVFDSTFHKYAITFKNGTTTLLVSDVAFGSKPIYTGVVPTKVSTEKYDYVFNSWSPAITSVTGAATYTAVFDSTFHKYAITFKNGTTTLQTIDVAYGSTPSFTGTVPTKASTDKYAYIFKDWNPKLTTVTGAASYTAVFDSVVNKYVITFANGAETLQSDSVLYGDLPEYKGAKTPAKASTEKYDYVFNSWSPTITSVTGATTYTAVFDSSLRKYSVTFKNETTTLQTSGVSYGSSPSYTGDTPAKSSTEKYDYTFKGWNPTITSVTGVATYTAVFDSTLRKYAVTFKNGSTTLQTSEIAYGSKPSYTGNTPTKASDKYTYKFKGWNPAIATVTKTATYQAVFDSTLRKYTITFKNGSTTLQTSEVAYGSKPSYTGSTPTKKATSKYTYKFKGWNPAIATVTKAATYQAVFDSTKVTGIIENRLASLDVTVRAVSRSIQISAASKNSTYAVLDMQGRVLLRGRVESSNFNIAVPRAGCYLVRVENATRKVQVK